jgi:hypothetical protein
MWKYPETQERLSRLSNGLNRPFLKIKMRVTENASRNIAAKSRLSSIPFHAKARMTRSSSIEPRQPVLDRALGGPTIWEAASFGVAVSEIDGAAPGRLRRLPLCKKDWDKITETEKQP